MFDGISTEELQLEIDSRKKKKQKLAKPKQLFQSNIDPLRKICQEYIDYLANDGFEDNDFDHYIFEVAIEAIFGPDVWKYINDQNK